NLNFNVDRIANTITTSPHGQQRCHPNANPPALAPYQPEPHPTPKAPSPSTANRTKSPNPESHRQQKQTKKDPALLEDIARSEIKTEETPDPEQPTTAETAITQQTDAEAKPLALPTQHPGANPDEILGGRAQESDLGATGGKAATGWLADEEALARSVTESQIKLYWRQKESPRLAPRVHQEGMTVYEKVLREWGMSGQFGGSRG
ncbi:hypothetical protein LTS01_016871, partial [Friedmanniomyces endolithicus]